MNNVNVPEMQRFVTTIQKDPAQAKKNKRETGLAKPERSAVTPRDQPLATFSIGRGSTLII